MSEVLLECGHTANATTVIDGKETPCCAICAGLNPGSTIPVVSQPSLEGRQAKCPDCKKIVPSSYKLAFFEYHGPGSYYSKMYCKHCHSYKDTHKEGHQYKVSCTNFEEGAVKEFDSYYCGCRGWS